MILIDTDIIRNECNGIETNRGHLNTDIAYLKNLITAFGKYWTGSDYDYFVEQMQDFYKMLDDVNASIDSYKEFLNGYCTVVEELHDYYENKKVYLK